MLPIEKEMLIASDQIEAIRNSSLWGADAGRPRAEHRFRRPGLFVVPRFSALYIQLYLSIMRKRFHGLKRLVSIWITRRSQGERLTASRNSVNPGTNITSITSLAPNSPLPPIGLITSRNGPPKLSPEHTMVKPSERRNGKACSVRV